MKSTKKVLAVILAAVMLFTVCTFSAFATPISTNDNEYLYYTDKIEAEGRLEYKPATHSVELRLYCTNNGYDSVSEYHLFAQCAVNYTDGSQDFFTMSKREFIAFDYPTKYALDTFQLSSGKTVESFDAEFFVWYENETLWEGQIYEPLA